jgi:hypothetical protein
LNFKEGGAVKKTSLLLSLAIALCLAMPAFGDVVVKHKSNAEMGGMMSMEMTGTDNVKSDRSYNEVTTKMTGGMMTMLGKDKPKETVSITRLDKGVVWDVDPEKKSYTEKTLESMKAKLEDAKEESKDEKSESDYIWTVDVKTVDQRQNINGFDCKEVIGTATGVKKDTKADTIFITFDQWMANNVPGTTEMETYHKNYAKAIGADEMMADKNMGEMLKNYGGQFEALAVKMSEAGGYPIKMTMRVENAGKPGLEGEKAEESQEKNKSMTEMMGKMFGKKKEANTEKKEESKNGRMTSFSFTNEVLSIEVKPVGDSQFEVPTGYKKK